MQGVQSAVIAQSARVRVKLTGYAARYEEDTRRVQRDIEIKDAGLKKPSMNDKITAQRTLGFQRGDVHGSESADRRISKRQSAARNARHRHKARK